MINDGNAGNAGQINQLGTAQISAKEFGAKFKSKRGKLLDTLDDTLRASNDQRHASAELFFGDGPFAW